MFDTMTWTKIVGGLCGALLVFMLGSWFAQIVYGTYPATDYAHREGEDAVQGFIIPVEEEAAAAAPELTVEERIAEFQAAFAVADAAAGEAEFRTCAACHAIVAGENRTGPYLAGIVGRPADAVAGFNYSGAVSAVVDVWTLEHLNFFLEDPRGYTPGTTMNYRGVDDVQERANLIAYLATL
jgi:cytochrome c